MTFRFPYFALLVFSFVGFAGCGSDESPAGPSDEAGVMSAVINGEAWTASAPFVQAQFNQSQSLLVLFAADPSADFGMGITLAEVAGTGTFEIRPGFPLRSAVVTVGGQTGWATEFSGTPGSIAITEFSSTRARGTFSFTAEPSPTSSQTGTLTVAQGQFNVPVIAVGQGLVRKDPARGVR